MNNTGPYIYGAQTTNVYGPLTFVEQASAVSSDFIYVTETLATTLTGVWAMAQNITLTLSKNGNLISIYFPETIDTSNASAPIAVTAPLPAAYIPSINIYQPCFVEDDGTRQWGIIHIAPITGIMTIYASLTEASFTGLAGDTGIARCHTISFTQ